MNKKKDASFLVDHFTVLLQEASLLFEKTILSSASQVHTLLRDVTGIALAVAAGGITLVTAGDQFLKNKDLALWGIFLAIISVILNFTVRIRLNRFTEKMTTDFFETYSTIINGARAKQYPSKETEGLSEGLDKLMRSDKRIFSITSIPLYIKHYDIVTVAILLSGIILIVASLWRTA